MDNKKMLIEVAPFNLDEFNQSNEPLDSQLNVWIPKKHKEKYIRLQSRSSRKFSNSLRSLIVQFLDSIKE